MLSYRNSIVFDRKLSLSLLYCDPYIAKNKSSGLSPDPKILRFLRFGIKENPFPYFKAADISATLSYYEGLCGAVNEVKVIGKPVLATQFSGIYKQIVDEQSGLIVVNDEDAIFDGLKRLLTDDKLRKKLTNNALPKMIMDDEYKIERLKKLIETKVEENQIDQCD